MARERPETAAATGPTATTSSDPGPRVLYVAGLGRSGSTLLDRLLGTVPGVFSGGELAEVWRFGFGENRPCSCGKLFLDCPFYREVLREAFGEPLGVDPLALRDTRFRAQRWRNVILIPAGLLTPAQRRGVRQLAEAQSKLYRAVARVSGASVIVDSSKHPAQAVISRQAVTDFRVLHLVRDSRGHSFSWQRAKPQPEARGEMGAMHIFPPRKAAWAWMCSNALIELMLRRRKRYLRVSYEALTAAPEQVLRRVLDFAGIAQPAPARGPNGGFQLALMHLASGNPMRYEAGEIQVREDNEWRTAMRRRDKVLVTALTLPGLVRYGYFRLPLGRTGSHRT